MAKIRIVIEKTINMVNNDEYVLFRDVDPTILDDLREEVSSSLYERGIGKIVVFRLVHPGEIQEGLDTNFQGAKWDEKEPEITAIIDAHSKIKDRYLLEKKYGRKGRDEKKALADFVAEYIAYNYYDCLSGGCPKMVLAFMRYLCISVNPEATIYPGKVRDHKCESNDDMDGLPVRECKECWYTVQDFMDDMDKSGIPWLPDLEEKYSGKLPELKMS